jgi:hypothetical protein
MTVTSTDNQVIRNKQRMMQPIVFQGASSVGGFSDIDACYDVKGKALVLIEVKRKGSPITMGQNILLDRMVMWCQKPCYALTVWHDAEEGEDIILKDCTVQSMTMQDPNTGKPVNKPAGNKHTVRDIVAFIEKKHL